jgi:putative ABC transport system permease protein
MAFRKLTVREFRRRPGRATLTLLSIAIGIAAYISVSLAINTAREETRKMYAAVTGRAALEITTENSGKVPPDLIAQLQAIGGVKAAIPSVQRFTVLYSEHKQFQLFLMGIDPAEDPGVRDYQVAEGSFLEGGNNILLEESFARAAGIHVNDKVKLLTASGRPQPFTVGGLLSPSGVAGFNKGGTVFMPLKTALRLFPRPGINHIDIVPAESANEETLVADVKRLVPAGLDVHRPVMRTQVAEEKSLNIELGLQFASMLTGTLAVFIIANTFLMNIGERRQQLAVLRAVGATRGQVVRMLLGEGAVLGVVGTA